MSKLIFDHCYGKNSKDEFEINEKDVDDFIEQLNETNDRPVFSEHDSSKPIGKIVQIRKDTGSNSNMRIDIEIDSSKPIGAKILTNIEK